MTATEVSGAIELGLTQMIGTLLDWNSLLSGFIILLVAIDPVSRIPELVQSVPSHSHRRFALYAGVIKAAVLFAILLFGQVVLATLALHPGSFQIASGTVLFLVGSAMTFGFSKTQVEAPENRSSWPGAAFPLATPLVASPGAMLAILILGEKGTLIEDVVVAISLAMAIAVTAGLLAGAKPVLRLIGENGVRVISRIMGLALAVIALDTLLNGFGAAVS